MCDPEVKCTCGCHTELERWERFQNAADLEKSWMAARLNWLLVPQGILFGALALLFKSPNNGDEMPVTVEEMALIVSIVGIALAFIGLVGTVAAGRMHFRWVTEVKAIAETLNKDSENRPLVPFGLKPNWPARSSSFTPGFVALSFLCAWAYLLAEFLQ